MGDSKMKHTPAPWVLWVEDALVTDNIRIYMGSALASPRRYRAHHMFSFDGYLDELGRKGDAPYEEALANLRLMASAPELHAAATEVMHALCHVDEPFDMKARVALAKKLADATRHEWPPYPNRMEDEEDA